MTTYYVGKGGDDANSGLTWDLRKLTLNGAENAPVQAGDTIYVGAGTYREQLTLIVSGTDGNPITYIGDYDGSHTDGVGGVVRITGSDDDITTTRDNCITISQKNYRTFKGFKIDLASIRGIYSWGACTNLILDEMIIGPNTSHGISLYGATNCTIKNCYISNGCRVNIGGIYFPHSTGISDSGNLIQNTIITNCYRGILLERFGGVTIKNCTICGCIDGVTVGIANPVGQAHIVNNSVLFGNMNGLVATVNGEIIEDYNSLSYNRTNRTNVAVGANSNTYPPLFDGRWFFEMVHGKKLITPFDLSSASQLINVAGTSPTTTDMRGVSVIGAQREWGALEYDTALKYRTFPKGGMNPLGGG